MVGDGFERRRQIENEAWANELASLREMFDPVPAKADGMASDGRPECPRSQAAERTAGLLPFDRRVSHRRPVRATGASNTDAYPRTLTPQSAEEGPSAGRRAPSSRSTVTHG